MVTVESRRRTLITEIRLMINFLATTLLSATLGQCVTYSQSGGGGYNCGIFGFPPANGTAVNDFGWRCGYYQDCESADHPFVWPQGGTFTPITFVEPVIMARAYDVSRIGVAVGYTWRSGISGARAFTFHDQQVTILDPLPSDNWSEAYGVNSAGLVVGMSSGSTGVRAARWISNAVDTLPLTLGPSSTANDVNEGGQVCGWMGIHPNPQYGGATPFIWHNGVTTSLPVPIPATNASGEAIAINNFGDACGIFYVPNPAGGKVPYVQRPCAWLGGQFIDLGIFPGCWRAYTKDINDAREIVGYCQTNDGEYMPFVWRNGVMIDLRTVNPVAPPGLGLKYPEGINNKGQITGNASMYGPGGHGVAFLLTPALPATPGDTNCDGHANVFDLLAVIAHWSSGPVGGEPADVNRDNRIDVADLLAVISNWS